MSAGQQTGPMSPTPAQRRVLNSVRAGMVQVPDPFVETAAVELTAAAEAQR